MSRLDSFKAQCKDFKCQHVNAADKVLKHCQGLCLFVKCGLKCLRVVMSETTSAALTVNDVDYCLNSI